MLRTLLTVVIALATAASANLAAAQSPAERPDVPLDAFVGSDSFGGLDIAADGGAILTSGNATGTYQPLQIDARSGAKHPWSSIQLKGVAEGYLSDGRVLLSADSAGDEVYHLFACTRAGSCHDLIAGAKITADFQGWSSDHRAFFMGINASDPRYFDLYEVDASTLAKRLLMKGGDFRLNRPGFGNYVAVSSDRRFVAVERVISNVKSDVYVHDVTTGTDVDITTSSAPVINRPLSFAPHGDVLYYLTDGNGEYLQLVAYDVRGGSSKIIVDVPADVRYTVFSRSGAYAVVGLDQQGVTEVCLYALPSWRRIPLHALPAGVVSTVSFAPRDKYFALILRTPTTPGDVYVVDPKSGQARRTVPAWPPDFPSDRLVTASKRSFKSFDGLEIAGVLYDPPSRPGGVKRAVIWVHGGPNGQAELDYMPLLQYLALRGYAVYAVNHRGSTGSGKTFARLDDRRHGEDDLRDLLAAQGLLVSEGFADPGHVAIAGGSFGGYLTLAAITTYPHAFGAALDMFGIADWNRVLNATPKTWTSRRIALTSEIGDPDEDGGAYLRSISPIYKLDKLSIPIIVMQGVNDPRVPKSESDTVVAAAERAHVPVEYLVFADEGHNWPTHKSNEVRALTRIAAFFDAHL